MPASQARRPDRFLRRYRSEPRMNRLRRNIRDAGAFHGYVAGTAEQPEGLPVDLITASHKRLPLAVETSPGKYCIVCEVVRLENGAIVWSDYAWLDNIGHAIYTFHFLEAGPACDGPESHAGGLRFFEIGEDDERLMSAWRSYESAVIRRGSGVRPGSGLEKKPLFAAAGHA